VLHGLDNFGRGSMMRALCVRKRRYGKLFRRALVLTRRLLRARGRLTAAFALALFVPVASAAPAPSAAALALALLAVSCADRLPTDGSGPENTPQAGVEEWFADRAREAGLAAGATPR